MSGIRQALAGWGGTGRIVAEGSAALAVSALLGLTLSGSSELASTLAVLPLVATLLLWVERRAAGVRHAALLSRVTRQVDNAKFGVLLSLWALLGVCLPMLSLPDAAPVWIASLVVLLAVRLAWQLPRLVPLLALSPSRPSLAFVLLPFAVYLALLPWSTQERPPDGDEPYYLLVTHSLISDLDVDLADDYAESASLSFSNRQLEPQLGDPRGPQGQQYSRHNRLLPLLLVPGYLVASKHGALLTMALLSALLSWATLRLAWHYPELSRRRGPLLLAWALLAFTPPLLLYSYQVWVEVPAALLVVLALTAVLDLTRRTVPGRPLVRWLLALLWLVALPLLKLRFLLLVVPLVVLALLRVRRLPRAQRRRWYGLAAILVLLAGGVLLFNYLVFGNALKVHSAEELELYRYPLANYLKGASGLLFDVAFGLFFCAPVWLLLAPATPAVLRHHRRLAGHAALLFLPYLVTVLPRGEWFGGWAPPFRYALVSLPWLALCLVPVLARSVYRSQNRSYGGRNLLVSLLGVSTLIATALWVAVPGWTYNLAAGSHHLLDHLSLAWGQDVIRFFPSAVRPRLATWLWPLAMLALAALLWAWPGHRSGSVGRRQGTAGSSLISAAALLLLVGALLPLAAARWPTHVVEAEDAYVSHEGGRLYPERWALLRPSFRGGWALRIRNWLSAPVRPAGQRVRLRVAAHFVCKEPSSPRVFLEARAGRQVLARWYPTPEQAGAGWIELESEVVEWPDDGQPLVVHARLWRRSGDQGIPQEAVVVDRVELQWLH